MGSASCKTADESEGVISESMMSSLSPLESDSFVEGVICKEEELPADNGMKTFNFEGGKVLLANYEGKLYALGSRCTHYGANLENGVLGNGHIRCAFHGACFKLTTGDLEEFPGLDSIPRYDVNVYEGEVTVRARKSHLMANKRTRRMAKLDPANNTNFVIIGAGAAGDSCAETLRQEGFTGNLLMLTQEMHDPYDRPMLSKSMHLPPEEITLRTPQFYQTFDIVVAKGIQVTQLDTTAKKLQWVRSTDDEGAKNSPIYYDKLFIATGGCPILLDVPGFDLNGVFTIRTPEDANAVAQQAEGKKVVVIGTSFIGMEVAAYLVRKGSAVTVIGRSEFPFSRTLGPQIGERFMRWFMDNGVEFRNNEGVTEILGDDGQVTQVTLKNGDTIDADIIVLGIGVRPATDFIAASPNASINYLKDEGFISVDQYLNAGNPSVFCGGDIVYAPSFLQEEGMEPSAVAHWQMAQQQGHCAALNMLGKKQPFHSVPYFWTNMFDQRVRYAGYGHDFDDILVTGDLEGLKFIAHYCRGNNVAAVATMGIDPGASHFAEMLLRGDQLTRQQVEDDGEVVMKL